MLRSVIGLRLREHLAEQTVAVKTHKAYSIDNVLALEDLRMVAVSAESLYAVNPWQIAIPDCPSHMPLLFDSIADSPNPTSTRSTCRRSRYATVYLNMSSSSST